MSELRYLSNTGNRFWMMAVSTRQLVFSSAGANHGGESAPVGKEIMGKKLSVGRTHLSLLPYTQPSSGPSGKGTSSSEIRPGWPAMG